MSVDTKQLNALCKFIDNIETRRKVIEIYKDIDTAFTGNNEHKETVELHVTPTGMMIRTYQNNGWVRVNYYNVSGVAECESYEGRWK